VVVPPTVKFQACQAGVPAVLAVHHVVGFAAGGGLVAAAGELAPLAAPRGALLYSRFNREEFGGYSWV
jgi:hypothetical protein